MLVSRSVQDKKRTPRAFCLSEPASHERERERERESETDQEVKICLHPEGSLLSGGLFAVTRMKDMLLCHLVRVHVLDYEVLQVFRLACWHDLDENSRLRC